MKSMAKTPKKPLRKAAIKQTDPVEVFCRLRPLENANDLSCVKVLDSTTIQLTLPENTTVLRNGNVCKEVHSTFKRVFDESMSQKLIFDHIALPLVEDVLKGKNALLFAYGVTNSGKTYTMTGAPQNQGILPRCLDVIFNSLNDLQAKKYVFRPDRMNGFEVQTEADAMLERQRRDIMPKFGSFAGGTPKTPGTPGGRETADRYIASSAKMPRVRETYRMEDVDEDNNYSVFVSYVEIYNNYIYDLLEELQYDPITGYKAPTSKILREDSEHNMYVSGIVETEVKSTEEAYDMFCKGQKRRKVAHTALNTESSRSHSVFCIRVVQAPLDPIGEEVLQDVEKICVSQLSLVDLAGSERLGRTGNAGDRLREAGNINQSLMVLRSCIEILRENQKSEPNKPKQMVPYRDSRLTHLFKNYFDGEGKVKMIVCVNPSASEYDETMQVMKFAELTQEVQVARPLGPAAYFDVGLTPGRRKMHQQYKEAEARAAVTDKPGVAFMPEPLSYSLGPQFPLLTLADPNDDRCLNQLANFLRDREIRRNTLIADVGRKEERMRSRLLEIDAENASLKRRVTELESVTSSKDLEMTRAKRRLSALERENEALQARTALYEQERRHLEKEVGEKEWNILQEKMEKDRLHQDYKAKLVLTEQQYNQRIEQTTRKLRQETSAQLNAKQQKLDLLRNIIESDSTTDGVGNTPLTRLRQAPPPPRGTGMSTRIFPAQSEPDLSSLTSSEGSNKGQPPPTPRTASRPQTASTSRPPVISVVAPPSYSRPLNRAPRAKSPPPVKPKPVINQKFHRRSKSSEVWLDHRPEGTVEIGTLLQPKMKKRKSVTTLNDKGNMKEATKYVLTHQDLDADGDLSTKLVKGDILTTAGGGSAVIFHDVEVITQKSPGDRKRRSPALQPEDFEGEWTDVETRCNIAIEGHGGQKKQKSSQV